MYYRITKSDILHFFSVYGYGPDGRVWVYVHDIPLQIICSKIDEIYPAKFGRESRITIAVKELVKSGLLNLPHNLYLFASDINELAEEGYLEKSKMPDEEGLLVIKFKPVKDFGKMKAGYDKKVNEHNAEGVDCATLSTIL